MLLNVKICLMIYVLMRNEILWLSFSFFRKFLLNEMLLNVKIWLIIYVVMRDEIISNNLMDSFWQQSCLKFIHFSAFVLHSCFGKIHWLNLRIYSSFFFIKLAAMQNFYTRADSEYSAYKKRAQPLFRLWSRDHWRF